MPAHAPDEGRYVAETSLAAFTRRAAGAGRGGRCYWHVDRTRARLAAALGRDVPAP